MKERIKRKAEAVWEITALLQNAKELNTALSLSLETVIAALDSEAGTIWLLDRRSDRLFPVFNRGPVDISGITIENGQGIAGTVIQSGEAVIVEDVSADSRFSLSVDEESSFQTKSVICVPLTVDGETIGCIQVINKRSGALFGEKDLSLCEELAALAGIAIREKGLTVETGTEKEVLIRLRGISKSYPSGDGVLQVLKGVNLDIYRNEFLVILGESGCGKSTLVNIIGGMERPSGGTITVEGKDFSDPSEAELTEFRRNYLGFVFQFYNLMPNLTAWENVRFIAELVDDPLPVEDALARVRLLDRADHYPSMLSGGQQQRVAIARAIVKRPTVLFADEPTAALDYHTSLEVLSAFEEIRRGQGTSIVLITHNPEIARMADRVIRLKDGRISSIRVNLHPASAAELSW
jgi:ABC-type lipoprotein export system ATPase subunit